MSASVKAKGSNWDADELRCLLLMWADPDIQESLKSKVRNKPIFARLAIEVGKAGYPARDGNACRDKINRVRKQYRDIRDQTRLSGQGTEDDIPFWFDIIETIMGDKPATCPVATLDTGTFDEHEGVTRPSSVSSDIDNHDEYPIIQPAAAAGPSTSGSGTITSSGDNPVNVEDSDDRPDVSYERISDDSDDDMLPVQSPGGDDTNLDDTTETDQKPEAIGKDKKGKKPLKRRAGKEAKTKQLVAELQASTQEVKQEMKAIEKRQRVSEEQERQERERELEGKKETEERWRREDREQAERLHREDRDFKMAMMAMMERQTAIMATMMGQPMAPPHASFIPHQAPPHLAHHNQAPPQHAHHNQAPPQHAHHNQAPPHHAQHHQGPHHPQTSDSEKDYFQM